MCIPSREDLEFNHEYDIFYGNNINHMQEKNELINGDNIKCCKICREVGKWVKSIDREFGDLGAYIKAPRIKLLSHSAKSCPYKYYYGIENEKEYRILMNDVDMFFCQKESEYKQTIQNNDDKTDTMARKYERDFNNKVSEMAQKIAEMAQKIAEMEKKQAEMEKKHKEDMDESLIVIDELIEKLKN